MRMDPRDSSITIAAECNLRLCLQVDVPRASIALECGSSFKRQIYSMCVPLHS
jgi:hypothetical protein